MPIGARMPPHRRRSAQRELTPVANRKRCRGVCQVCVYTCRKATRALLMDAERLSPLKKVSITFSHVRSCATQLAVSSADVSSAGGGIVVCCGCEGARCLSDEWKHHT